MLNCKDCPYYWYDRYLERDSCHFQENDIIPAPCEDEYYDEDIPYDYGIEGDYE